MQTTLGIDLASQANKTGVCAIEWLDGGARVKTLQRGGSGAEDESLRAAIRAGHAKVAIDAPLGWPVDFVAALSAHARFEQWPGAGELTHRLTDRIVHKDVGKQPLSVSTDKIAYCAFRCARLLSGLDAPRDGSGLVVEAYPDAALRRWLPDSFLESRTPSYKGKPGSARRTQLVDELFSRLGARFAIDDAQQAACVASDDGLDALLCALIARAAERGKTVPPGDEHAASARVEGWIHLPEPGSLSELIG